jgi:hypothetical protein
MTLWEFAAVMEGFRKFNGIQPAKPASESHVTEENAHDWAASLGIEGFEHE